MMAWLETFARAMTCVGVVVAALSIYFNTRRAQKELAVRLLSEWSKEYDLQMKHAFELGKLIGSSGIEQIRRRSAKFENKTAVAAVKSVFSAMQRPLPEDGDAASMELTPA